ncbi:MAG: polysaccharide biosynthesis/export family protein [Rikenellaceae bacterium]
MRKLLLLSMLMLVCSCASVKNISYFQDTVNGTTNELAEVQTIKVQPEDKISIVVNSKDPMLMQLVNLPDANVRVSGQTNSTNTEVSGYTVNKQGEIDFPVLGNVYVAGQTREEIALLIKKKLIFEEVVKDPVVTVEFVNLTVSVMGEVKNPGKYNIDKEKITILDALSMAGDMTIYGLRENVIVLRESKGKQITYKVNLLDAQSLLQSPAYYLTQNDIVYVEPNSVRARQSTVNGNTVRSTSFWLSLASFLTTVTILFVN